MKDKIPAELAKKQKKLKDLSNLISMAGNVLLTKEQKQEIDNAKFRMEFQLNQLLDEVKLREADIKIASFEKVLETIKQK